MKKLFYYIILSYFVVSCAGGYSFTGASIEPGTNTFYVEAFENRASIVQPILSTELTEDLISKVRSSTNLRFDSDGADIVFKGVITSYSVSPTAIQGDDRAAKNRLTITIRMTFTNNKNEKMSYEQSFTRFKDYDSELSLNDVEEALIKQINEELVEDVFNKALVNW